MIGTQVRGEVRQAGLSGIYLSPETPWGRQPAALMQLFSTPRRAAPYARDTFPIVRRKEEDESGDYRTKRVILAIYDALAGVHPHRPAVPDPPRPAAGGPEVLSSAKATIPGHRRVTAKG